MSLVRSLTTSTSTAVIAVALAAFVAVGPSAQASTASSFESLTNSARVSAGLAPYSVSSDLSTVALAQARRMAAAQKLYHNPGLATAVKNWSWVGENVGYGPDVVTLQSAFMHSPDHRANILDHQFTQVGVGAVTVNGTIWVSVVFRRPLHATTSSTVRPTRTGARATAGSPAAVTVHPKVALVVPRGVRCSASKAVAGQIMGLASGDHSARLVEQAQRLLIGYQCAKKLPMTGLLDPATLRAIAA